MYKNKEFVHRVVIKGRSLYQDAGQQNMKKAEGIVCFYRNCKFHNASIDFIFLYKTQTKNSKFFTVLVEQKEANIFPLSAPQRKNRVTQCFQMYLHYHKYTQVYTKYLYSVCIKVRHIDTHTHTHRRYFISCNKTLKTLKLVVETP